MGTKPSKIRREEALQLVKIAQDAGLFAGEVLVTEDDDGTVTIRLGRERDLKGLKAAAGRVGLGVKETGKGRRCWFVTLHRPAGDSDPNTAAGETPVQGTPEEISRRTDRTRKPRGGLEQLVDLVMEAESDTVPDPFLGS